MLRKKRFWVTVVLVACFAVALVPLGPSVLADGSDANEGQAYAVVNGAEVPIAIGDVIATGKSCPDGSCDIPRTQIKFKGTEDGNVNIIATVMENCELVVSDIKFDKGAIPSDDVAIAAIKPAEKDSRAIYNYRGWVKSEYNCPFGMDLSSVWAEMKYYDNGTSVYSGYDRVNWQATAFDFKCTGWGWYWWPYGPSSVYTATYGNFEFISWGWWKHYHKAKFIGYPNGGYTMIWTQSGSTVPGGYWAHSGSRITL